MVLILRPRGEVRRVRGRSRAGEEHVANLPDLVGVILQADDGVGGLTIRGKDHEILARKAEPRAQRALRTPLRPSHRFGSHLGSPLKHSNEISSPCLLNEKGQPLSLSQMPIKSSSNRRHPGPFGGSSPL